MQNHFTVIVAGNNPDSLMNAYDKTKKMEPYVVYKFNEKEEYRKKYIEFYQEALKTLEDGDLKESMQIRLNEIITMDDITFYSDLTQDLEIDQETGDAFSTENMFGKYDTCNIGGRFAIPFITNEGEETYKAKKGDIDFSKLHMCNIAPYQVAWETVMEGRKPRGAEEERIYENMKNRTSYFETFGTKEKYITWSCSFWAYAFVDKNGWHEFEGNVDDQIEWVANFYDNFIKKLSKNTILTIYECTRM